MADESSKKQPTQPKKGEPIEIPVPKRGEFDKMVKRAAKKSASDAGRPSK